MKVFVVGNIALDQTLAVDRIPFEGESVFGRHVSSDLGGKGTNQAIVLARCGVETVLVAGLGTDLQRHERVDGCFLVQAGDLSGLMLVQKQ
ncbi:MAG: PfkB family carbohydrate kinase [Jannaschia sp.]